MVYILNNTQFISMARSGDYAESVVPVRRHKQNTTKTKSLDVERFMAQSPRQEPSSLGLPGNADIVRASDSRRYCRALLLLLTISKCTRRRGVLPHHRRQGKMSWPSRDRPLGILRMRINQTANPEKANRKFPAESSRTTICLSAFPVHGFIQVCRKTQKPLATPSPPSPHLPSKGKTLCAERSGTMPVGNQHLPPSFPRTSWEIDDLLYHEILALEKGKQTTRR